jgi:adenosylhomocysteinase
MDISFAVQALTLEWLARHRAGAGVHEVPAAIDDEVAATKLAALGVELDVLTPAQERYLSTWRS